MPPVAGFLAIPVIAGITVGQILFVVGLFLYLRSRRERGSGGGVGEPAPVTVRQSALPAQWVVGRWRAYGLLCNLDEWEETEDPKRLILRQILVFSEATCDGLEYVWINERRLTVTGFSGGKVSLSTGGLSANEPFLETVVSCRAGLNGGGSSRRGLMWLEIRLRSTLQDTGQPELYTGIPEISVTMRGVRTQGEGGAAVWSANAADVTRWFLRTVRGIPASEIDDTSYLAARAWCAARRLECHGVISSEEDPRGVQAALEAAWGGSVVDSGDSYHFVLPTATAAVETIEPRHVVEEPSIVVAPELSSRVNRVIGEYSDYTAPGTTGTDRTASRREDTAAISADGGVLESSLGRMRFVVHESQAQWVLARRLAERYEYPIVTVTVPHGDDTDPVRFLELIPGDTVTLALGTDAGLDWTGQLVSSVPRGEHLLDLTVRRFGLLEPDAAPTAAPVVTVDADALDVTATAAGGVGDSEVDSYSWQLTDGTGGLLEEGVTTVESWTPSYPLEEGADYQIRVRLCGTGWGTMCGAWSDYATWTTATASDALALPVLTVLQPSATSVQFAVAVTTDAGVYRWQLRPTDDPTTVRSRSTVSSAAVYYDLTAGTNYQVRWSACRVGGVGCSVWSGWTDFATPA